MLQSASKSSATLHNETLKKTVLCQPLSGSGQYGLSIHRRNSTTANEISSLPNDDKSRLIDLNSCPQLGQVFAVVEILWPHSLHFAIAIVGPPYFTLTSRLIPNSTPPSSDGTARNVISRRLLTTQFGVVQSGGRKFTIRSFRRLPGQPQDRRQSEWRPPPVIRRRNFLSQWTPHVRSLVTDW